MNRKGRKGHKGKREDEPTKEALLEDFRQAWHEAMTGKTIPVSQIWERLDDNENG